MDGASASGPGGIATEQSKERLEKKGTAEEKLGRLALSGKGRKIWRQEEELRAAIAAIEKEPGQAVTVSVSKEEGDEKLQQTR